MAFRDEFSLAFSKCLTRARIANHLTQEKVAEEVDITPRWYQELEYGHKLGGLAVSLRLMDLLGFSCEDVIKELDHPLSYYLSQKIEADEDK